MKLGDGAFPTLSPDGKWALAMSPGLTRTLVKIPTGAGESTRIATGNVQAQGAYFFPDGRRILLIGSEPGHGLRLWVVDSDNAAPHPVSPEGVSFRYRGCIAPDG